MGLTTWRDGAAGSGAAQSLTFYSEFFDVLSDGAATAVIQGDPSKPGIYVIRVKFPPHTFSKPHYHMEERHVVVLQGTWYTGTGETFDPDKAVGLKPGSYMMHPARAVHWDGAKDEEVILQIIGYGPTDTVLIKPADGLFTATH